MANQVNPIELDDRERAELERVRRSSSVRAGLSRRARAVLLMAEGVPGVVIARRTGYTPVQVSRIRRRFAEERLAGLRERPRSGRPHSVTPRKIAQVVALTLRPPPAGTTHWTTGEMAKRTGLSRTMIHRIWRAHGLKPHRVETFKFTPDPEEKIRDIVGLYLSTRPGPHVGKGIEEDQLGEGGAVDALASSHVKSASDGADPDRETSAG